MAMNRYTVGEHDTRRHTPGSRISCCGNTWPSLSRELSILRVPAVTCEHPDSQTEHGSSPSTRPAPDAFLLEVYLSSSVHEVRCGGAVNLMVGCEPTYGVNLQPSAPGRAVKCK